jgi:hypothetical protein
MVVVVGFAMDLLIRREEELGAVFSWMVEDV